MSFKHLFHFYYFKCTHKEKEQCNKLPYNHHPAPVIFSNIVSSSPSTFLEGVF